jgi:hypothetical protein
VAKHNFVIAMYEDGVIVGAQCSRCSQMALYVNGQVPEDIRSQECPAKREDFSQAAARIVREATEKD